jgi:heme-degrading monooxygenase HmoA
VSVRVLVHAAVAPEDADSFEASFVAVTERIRRVPGFVSSELLRAAAPGDYVICAEWISREAFLAWTTSPVHPATTAPMSRYWRPLQRSVYEIVVRLDAPDASTAGD